MAKGLGKGLGALMGDFAVETPAGNSPYQMLPIHKVEPNPDQPRRDFDPTHQGQASQQSSLIIKE